MARKSLGFVFGVGLRSGSCDGGFARDHNVGGFPKASERFGWASDGNDLPAGSLEGVLRLGKRHRGGP